MKQLLKENSKWKNVGWFFRILFMIFALTPGCLTTLSDGLDGLHVEMVFLTMGVGAVCWITTVSYTHLDVYKRQPQT